MGDFRRPVIEHAQRTTTAALQQHRKEEQGGDKTMPLLTGLQRTVLLIDMLGSISHNRSIRVYSSLANIHGPPQGY